MLGVGKRLIGIGFLLVSEEGLEGRHKEIRLWLL